MGPLDYRSIAIILPFMLHIRVLTIIILVLSLFGFWILQQKRIEPDNVLRWLRSIMAGKSRTAHGRGRLRQPVDYGFETQDLVAQAQRRMRAIREHRKSPKYKGRRLPDIKIGPSRLLPLQKRLTARGMG